MCIRDRQYTSNSNNNNNNNNDNNPFVNQEALEGATKNAGQLLAKTDASKR